MSSGSGSSLWSRRSATRAAGEISVATEHGASHVLMRPGRAVGCGAPRLPIGRVGMPRGRGTNRRPSRSPPSPLSRVCPVAISEPTSRTRMAGAVVATGAPAAVVNGPVAYGRARGSGWALTGADGVVIGIGEVRRAAYGHRVCHSATTSQAGVDAARALLRPRPRASESGWDAERQRVRISRGTRWRVGDRRPSGDPHCRCAARCCRGRAAGQRAPSRSRRGHDAGQDGGHVVIGAGQRTGRTPGRPRQADAALRPRRASAPRPGTARERPPVAGAERDVGQGGRDVIPGKGPKRVPRPFA